MMVEMIITGAPNGWDSGDWGGATKQQQNDKKQLMGGHKMQVSLQIAYDERLLYIKSF